MDTLTTKMYCRKCSLCDKRSGSFFKVPLDENKRYRWNKSCRTIFKKFAIICQDHFAIKDFLVPPGGSTRPLLHDDAIPTMIQHQDDNTDWEIDFYARQSENDTIRSSKKNRNYFNELEEKNVELTDTSSTFNDYLPTNCLVNFEKPANDEDILMHCTKKCGVITATEDQSYFALGCMFCPEKFLYFDAFIAHIQAIHTAWGQNDMFGGIFGEPFTDIEGGDKCGVVGMSTNVDDEEDDLTDTDPSLLEPQMIMIKEEILDEEQKGEDSLFTPLPNDDVLKNAADELSDYVKHEVNASMEMNDEHIFFNESHESYDDYGEDNPDISDDEEDENSFQEGRDINYDDLVEESLLGGSGLTMHIKDRKMIQFLIDSYRRNRFLWDHHHLQFRDRAKRSQFLDWMIVEFKRRFHITLARDAVTRKWDNLRTVYKRECNRMSLDKTNISTLWYFKELDFLNRIYGGNQKVAETIVKDPVVRRRYSALWNDVSTNKLLEMVERYPCFYDKNHSDYRSKDKRGEALQTMVTELQDIIEITTIQISKRISQLRFDYSKQKQERLYCEQNNKIFVPNYVYYEQMKFMDDDVAPFQCEHCPVILQTPREMDVHLLIHQSNGNGGVTGATTAGGGAGINAAVEVVNSFDGDGDEFVCEICQLNCNDGDQLLRHQQVQHQMHQPLKEVKYHCDLCTASFREKSNYDEHMRRHNDELLLPTLASNHGRGRGRIASTDNNDQSSDSQHHHHNHHHRVFHCDVPQCDRKFTSRQNLVEHTRSHFSDEEFQCDVCNKSFKSMKNLQNHRQIHDAIKKYVCKVCGSAFAQAAGLYLHKRRHNRPNSRVRHSYC